MSPAYATRLFPSVYTSPYASANLLFLAEGFAESTRLEFDAACRSAYDAILQTTPFNLTDTLPGWLNVFSYWVTNDDGATPYSAVVADTGVTVDTDALSAVLDDLKLVDESGGYELSARDLSLGAVVMLLPDGPEVEADITDPTSGALLCTAVSADGDWTRVVLRVLGRALGLGDEFELSDEEGSHLAPTPEEADRLEAHPNLSAATAPSGTVTGDFKWYWLLTDSERAGLSIVTHADPSLPDREAYTYDVPDDVMLVEGGGGYRTGVFRSAKDCVMRRQIGSADLSPRIDAVDFCKVCTAYLTFHLAGTLDPPRRATLDDQRLEYDLVQWSAPHGTTPVPFAAKPIGYSATAGDPTWSGTYEVTATEGLKITNLSISGLDPMLGSDVCSEIGFRDIALLLDDGTKLDFDLAAAIARAGTDAFALAFPGAKNATDKSYVWGCKLSLENELSAGDGRSCLLRVDTSLVLKSKAADFDPSWNPVAMKLYPQIGLSWKSVGEKKAVVASASATLRLVVNGWMTGVAENSNATSVICTSNVGLRDSERDVPQLGDPLWDVVFDYFRGDLRNELFFAAVFPESDPSMGTVPRPAVCRWPNPTSDFNIVKFARQGAYDDVHTHGVMAVDPKVPATGPADEGNYQVDAPGCGEACFHLHWRWAPAGFDRATKLTASFFAVSYRGEEGTALPESKRIVIADKGLQFLGWGKPAGGDWQSNILKGAPLIPPNQRLRIAVTDPSRDSSYVAGKVSDGSVTLGSSFERTGGPDDRKRALWYMVEIDAPKEEQRQVVFEQGAGFAFDYADDPEDFDSAYYQSLRWNGSTQRIPKGDTAVTKTGGGTVAAENL